MKCSNVVEYYMTFDRQWRIYAGRMGRNEPWKENILALAMRIGAGGGNMRPEYYICR